MDSRNSREPIEPVPGGVRIRVRVQPRASKTEVVGRHGDAIRIRLNAPPVDGAANEALVRFLADLLDVARSAVTLEQGHTGRTKVLRVEATDASLAARRLLPGDS
jgi:uncharacterized protein (TIGR00251 family)